MGAVQQDPALSSNREAHQHRDKMQQSKNQVCCRFGFEMSRFPSLLPSESLNIFGGLPCPDDSFICVCICVCVSVYTHVDRYRRIEIPIFSSVDKKQIIYTPILRIEDTKMCNE